MLIKIHPKVIEMETYLIELKSWQAQRLLQDLEDLNIIKVLGRNKQKGQKVGKSTSARFRGALKMSNEKYLDFQQHAKDIRNEWNKDI